MPSPTNADEWAGWDDPANYAQDRAMTDINGWREYPDTPLSRAGVFAYRGAQLRGAADPNKVYQVYRPAEELAAQDALDSFRLLPWVNEHAMLGAEDLGLLPAEEKGVQGVLGSVYFKDGTIYGNPKVFSEAMGQAIDSGKRELSCGYRCEYDWTPGRTPDGIAYDCVQRKIRGNHLALVEKGRMGSSVAVMDGITCDSIDFTPPTKGAEMADVNQGGAPSGNSAGEALTMLNTFLQGLPAMLEALKPLMGGTPAAEPSTPAGDAPAAEPPAAEPDKDDKGMDAADRGTMTLRQVMAEVAKRDALARDLSKVVGAFDHAEMTIEDVAAYGAEKLGIKADKATAVATISGYLAGIKSAKPAGAAQDAAAKPSAPAARPAFLTKYLGGN